MDTRETQIDLARRLIATGISDEAREVLEKQFPEVVESEDERIRKELVEFHKDAIQSLQFRERLYNDWEVLQHKKFIAYLEKQKEQPKEELGKYSEEENLAYRLNWVMQDYYKAGKDDEEREHRFKCYKLFWDALVRYPDYEVTLTQK